MNVPLVYHVLVPVLATVVLTGVEWLAAPTEDWRSRVMKVGSDLCILAGGLAGAFVHSENAPPSAHAEYDGAILAVSTLISVGAIGGISAIRRMGSPTGRKSLTAVLLGGAALGLPIYHIIAMSGAH